VQTIQQVAVRPRQRRGRRWELVVATALGVALLAAACSSTSTSGAPAPPGSTAGTSVPPAPADQPDRVMSLPGLGAPAAAQYAGYASVDEQPCASVRCDGPGEAGLFYWHVAKTGADPATTPTILWTNGGPGATSFWGFFTENGPYSVTDGGDLQPRTKAWNETANYLIFDHPLGVGLSFASEDQLPANVGEGVEQWYQALVHVLERHPEIAANPIVLAGESYGGTYVPLLAKAILDGNAAAGRDVVKLGGIILAAPWVDPLVQQSMDTTFALSHGLITEADKVRLDAVYVECKAAIEAATPSSKEAYDTCGKIKSGISDIAGVYMLNVGAPGDPPTDPVAAYLNRADVREAIHAKPDGEFTFFAEAIGDRYAIGGQDSYLGTVQEVLDRGVPVMVVSGLNDATDVNPLGVGAWLDLMTGERADAFHAAPTTQWKGSGTDVLGYVQAGGGLSWVKVLNAGHLAAMDQPQLIDLIDEKLLTP
jgi:cathepsin A (carboxypeptidase C)